MSDILPTIKLEVKVNEVEKIAEQVVAEEETVDDEVAEVNRMIAEMNMTDVSKEPFENHYVIQKELGRGKFATVYQCQKHSSNVLFAAKIVQTKSPKHVEESLTEVEILRAVNHEGIVKVFDVFQSKNSLTIVLELIGGGELFEKLANEDTVSEGQAASYTKQVLDAMAHLHSLRIAHLDLKPENLMLSAKDSDIIKVVDFGLAKRMNKRVVCMQGTPEFVPPEVIALDPLSTYSDMWSVGVIVYIMVSGYSPFMGDDDNETYGNIAMCDYEFYEDEFAKISEECKDFIKQLLVMKPTERMSASDASQHNWITSREDNTIRIENQKIKRFLAQRKWKAIKKAFDATNKFSALIGSKKGANANSLNITQVIAPSVNMDHRKLVVTEGDNISITAHVVSKPTCSWSKDGTALIVDKIKFNVIQSDCQSILVISKFARQDEGSYTIACSNPAGTTTATIQLITLGPTAPSVTIDKTEFVGIVGESVVIHADMVAHPKPTVSWEKNGKTCRGDRFITSIVNCEVSLDIKRLKETDAGSYTLKSKNNLGKGAATVCLRVTPIKKAETPAKDSPTAAKLAQKADKKPVDKKAVDKKPVKIESKAPQTATITNTKSALEAAMKPVEAVKKAVEATKKTVETTKKPVEVSKKPVEAAKKPVEAAKKPVETAKKLNTEAPKKPVESVKKPVEAVKKPVETAKKLNTEAPKKPVEADKKPAEAVKKPVETAKKLNTDAPKKPVEADKKPAEAPKKLVEAEIANSKIPEQKAVVVKPKPAPIEVKPMKPKMEKPVKPPENGTTVVAVQPRKDPLPVSNSTSSPFPGEASPSSSSDPTPKLEKAKSVDESVPMVPIPKEGVDAQGNKRVSMAAITDTKMKLITKKNQKNDECSIM